MTGTLTVALAQQPADRDPVDVVHQAAALGADVVVFPEMFSNGYARFEPGDRLAEAQWRAGALGLESRFVERCRAAAAEHSTHVVMTLLERGEPDPYNAALLIDPTGAILLHHRKVHICDFDSPESACGRGTSFDVGHIETEAGSVAVGLMICMDREFPDGAASLSSMGAEIVLVPNCCDLATDPDVGDVRLAQLRGRAFESVMGIAVTNYPAPKCDGHSIAVDPQGKVVAIAGTDRDILLAEFDLPAIRRTRRAEWFRWCPRDDGKARRAD